METFGGRNPEMPVGLDDWIMGVNNTDSSFNQGEEETIEERGKTPNTTNNKLIRLSD